MGLDEVVPHDERYAAAEEYLDLLYQYVTLNLDLLQCLLIVSETLGTIMGGWCTEVARRA